MFVKLACAPLCMGLRWFRAGGWWRRVVLAALVFAAWLSLTWLHFGPPPTNSADAWHLDITEYVWLAASSLSIVLFLCKGCRSMVVTMVIAIGTLLMNVFMSIAACALSMCFDTTAIGAAAAADADDGHE